MDPKFETSVQCLKRCWALRQHTITIEEKSAMKALRAIFINEKSDRFSPEMTLRWLANNQLAWGEEKHKHYRKLVYELNDVAISGTIKEDYEFLPTTYDTLPDDLKKYLNLYRDNLLSRLKFRASRDQLIHCVSFAAFLKNESITRAQDITVDIVSKYHAYAETTGDTYICLYSVRFFLDFLVSEKIIAEHIPYALTSPLQAKAIGYALTHFLSNEYSFESYGIDANEYWQEANRLIEVLRNKFHHNEDASRNNYLVYYQMFYIFIKEFSLPYNAANVRIWAEGMSGFMPEPFRAAAVKRSFYVLDIFLRTGKVTESDLDVVLCKPGRIVNLSENYKELLRLFLSCRAKDNVSAGTLDGNKSGALSFLVYIQNQEITELNDVSPINVKEYCAWTADKASNHKNNYAYDLRVFLIFCFEKGYTRQDLSRAIPAQSNQFRRIVKVLSDEEIQMIYQYRDQAKTPIQLRDSAILMLGLLMGLRRIDIVNLKFSNIDWNAQTISITQQKTYRPLVLPMPVSVGNSIYKYIKNGRARVSEEHDYIFLSMIAPFGKADPSSCELAVKHALNSPIGSFHTLRRTFASRLLTVGTKADTIKDSLGHSTMDTVNRYLSMDEESLRSCCLALERTVINCETAS